jgi:hypothetical protein
VFERLARILRSLEIEEKILHVGTLLCLAGLFCPWVGGQWSGMAQQWNGFGFHTGYIGHLVLLAQLFIFSVVALPLFGGPVLVRKSLRNNVRLILSTSCLLLLLCSFSILFRLTLEVSGAEIRFGIYVSLVGSSLTTLYSFLLLQEQRRLEARELFHHPDVSQPKKPLPPTTFDDDRPPPPPPPPPLEPEDHQPTRP